MADHDQVQEHQGYQRPHLPCPEPPVVLPSLLSLEIAVLQRCLRHQEQDLEALFRRLDAGIVTQPEGPAPGLLPTPPVSLPQADPDSPSARGPKRRRVAVTSTGSPALAPAFVPVPAAVPAPFPFPSPPPFVPDSPTAAGPSSEHRADAPRFIHGDNCAFCLRGDVDFNNALVTRDEEGRWTAPWLERHDLSGVRRRLFPPVPRRSSAEQLAGGELDEDEGREAVEAAGAEFTGDLAERLLEGTDEEEEEEEDDDDDEDGADVEEFQDALANVFWNDLCSSWQLLPDEDIFT